MTGCRDEGIQFGGRDASTVVPTFNGEAGGDVGKYEGGDAL